MSTISGFRPNQSGANYGASTVKPQILAPGTEVSMSAKHVDTEQVHLSGTGFAAPVVAGKAALLLATKPDLSVAELKNELVEDSQAAKIADRMAQNTLSAQKSLSVGHYNGGTGGFVPASMGATCRMWSGRNPVTVAVIDSGADAGHPALQGKLIEGSAITDELGSGTHIAGVIADPLGKHYQL